MAAARLVNVPELRAVAVAVAVAAALVAIPAPARADMACFSGPMEPTLIASAHRRIAGTGGMIVGSRTKLPDWRFRDMNRTVRPRVVQLAPGLAIYHPPPLPGTDVVLEDLDHGVIARAERALTIGDPPPPPKVESITVTTTGGDRRTVLAALASEPPSEAVVAITSRVEGGKLVPMAWTRLNGQPRAVVLWHTPFGCDETIPTAIEPKPGDKVVITWVDETGRLSEASNTVVVSGAPRRK